MEEVQEQSWEKIFELLNPTEFNIRSSETQVLQGRMEPEFSMQVKVSTPKPEGSWISVSQLPHEWVISYPLCL